MRRMIDMKAERTVAAVRLLLVVAALAKWERDEEALFSMDVPARIKATAERWDDGKRTHHHKVTQSRGWGVKHEAAMFKQLHEQSHDRDINTYLMLGEV